MKFDPKYKPELIAAKDPFGSVFNHVELDKVEKRLCATDGHRMVAIPVVVEEHDTDGPIDAKTIGEARKLAKSSKVDDAEIQCNGSLKLTNGATFTRPNRGGLSFPQWKTVVPPKCKPVIAFNAKYLKELAEAIGQDDYIVALAFDPTDPTSPIRVYATSSDKNSVRAMTDDTAPIAVLMPGKSARMVVRVASTLTGKRLELTRLTPHGGYDK